MSNNELNGTFPELSPEAKQVCAKQGIDINDIEDVYINRLTVNGNSTGELEIQIKMCDKQKKLLSKHFRLFRDLP